MSHLLTWAAASAAASLSVPAGAQAIAAAPATDPAPIAVPAVTAPSTGAVLPKGSLVRLMVLNEVNSREHKAGHRFVLRVDEDVKAGERIVIPIGAKAWGEVVDSSGTGAAGKSGRLNARLLYVDVDGRQVAVEGSRETKGSGGTGQAVAGVVGFGLLGLLMKGNNATLKAGEILNGYTLSDTDFGAAPAAGQ